MVATYQVLLTVLALSGNCVHADAVASNVRKRARIDFCGENRSVDLISQCNSHFALLPNRLIAITRDNSNLNSAVEPL